MRKRLREKHGECMICGSGPTRPLRSMLNDLCVHEIANGPNRQAALDKPFALLVLCFHCNGHVVTDKGQWPEARQLAVLLEKSPEDYDLVAYNHLVNPNAPRRIEQWEVDKWSRLAAETADGQTKAGTGTI